MADGEKPPDGCEELEADFTALPDDEVIEILHAQPSEHSPEFEELPIASIVRNEERLMDKIRFFVRSLRIILKKTILSAEKMKGSFPVLPEEGIVMPRYHERMEAELSGHEALDDDYLRIFSDPDLTNGVRIFEDPSQRFPLSEAPIETFKTKDGRKTITCMSHAGFGYRSRTGVDKRDEDRILVLERRLPDGAKTLSLLVADGLGGYAGGDVASFILCDEFQRLSRMDESDDALQNDYLRYLFEHIRSALELLPDSMADPVEKLFHERLIGIQGPLDAALFQSAKNDILRLIQHHPQFLKSHVFPFYLLRIFREGGVLNAENLNKLLPRLRTLPSIVNDHSPVARAVHDLLSKLTCDDFQGEAFFRLVDSIEMIQNEDVGKNNMGIPPRWSSLFTNTILIELGKIPEDVLSKMFSEGDVHKSEKHRTLFTTGMLGRLSASTVELLHIEFPTIMELAVVATRMRIAEERYRRNDLAMMSIAPDVCFMHVRITTTKEGQEYLEMEQMGDCRMMVADGHGKLIACSSTESHLDKPDLEDPGLTLDSLSTYSLNRNVVGNSLQTGGRKIKIGRRFSLANGREGERLEVKRGYVVYAYSDGVDDLYGPKKFLDAFHSNSLLQYFRSLFREMILQTSMESYYQSLSEKDEEGQSFGSSTLRRMLRWSEKRMRFVAQILETSGGSYLELHGNMNRGRLLKGSYEEAYEDGTIGKWDEPSKCDNLSIGRIDIG